MTFYEIDTVGQAFKKYLVVGTLLALAGAAGGFYYARKLSSPSQVSSSDGYNLRTLSESQSRFAPVSTNSVLSDIYESRRLNDFSGSGIRLDNDRNGVSFQNSRESQYYKWLDIRAKDRAYESK